MTRTKRVLAGLAAAALALSLTACGDDSSEPEATDAPAPAGDSEPAAEPSDEGGSESGTGSALSTLSNVEQLVASGSILPIRFPDPGKPEGIRTYRKPVMTMLWRWSRGNIFVHNSHSACNSRCFVSSYFRLYPRQAIQPLGLMFYCSNCCNPQTPPRSR